MIEFLYQTLAKIGYNHPIHPPVTHISVGMVIGAFLFALVANLMRHERLALTARHCILLAMIGLFPTALLGYMDWQHRYGGAWLFPIKIKIGLPLDRKHALEKAERFGERLMMANLQSGVPQQ